MICNFSNESSETTIRNGQDRVGHLKHPTRLRFQRLLVRPFLRIFGDRHFHLQHLAVEVPLQAVHDARQSLL